MRDKTYFKRLLKKFLIGTIRDKELEDLKKDLQSSFENLKDARQSYFGLIKIAGIKQNSAWIEKNLRKTKSKIHGKKVSINFQKIAAVFLLLIGLSGIVYLNHFSRSKIEWQTISADKGQIKEFLLPDSTKVYLGPASTIKFPDKFVGDCRGVQFRGEGFFKVKKNHQKPFILESPRSKIKVTGTSFNIKSYPQDKKEEVYLVEGGVDISFYSPEGRKLRKVTLEPFHKVEFDKEKNLVELRQFSLSESPSWMNGVLSFRDEAFTAILKTLERHYGKTIVFSNETGNSYNLNADFSNESLSEILESLKILVPFVFREEGEKVHITFKEDQN